MKKLTKMLKKNKLKFMVVSDDLANEIDEISKQLNTTSLDVICSGLELLKNSINKEVILRQPESGREKIISALKDLNVETKAE